MQLGDGNLGVDEDAVVALGPLELAGDLVQLVQPRALGVGDQQLDLGQRVLEGGLDPLPQLVEALPGQGRDQDRVPGGAAATSLPLVLVEQVGLVEDEQPRLVAGADLLEHRVDRPHVGQPPLLRRRRVDHVQDQVGEHRLLERRLEGLDQLVGQLLDEADRVGEQVVAAGELEAAGGRVEGVEEPVPHSRPRPRSAR